MSRRAVGGALAVASALLGLPASYADAPPPPQFPMAACDARVADTTGDGVPRFGADNVKGAPIVADPRGNVSSLDMTGITFRLTETRVYAFMSLDEVTAFRDADSAYGYTMWFTRGAGGKVARFEVVRANPALAARGLAPAADSVSASVGPTASGGAALRDVGGGVDTARNVAYVYASRASLDEQLGEPLMAGEELTAIDGRTELWETNGATAPGVVRRPADKVDVAPAEAVWTVGDDRCFAPSVFTVPAVAGQCGDRVTLVATLKDEAGAPLAGRAVRFAFTPESPAMAATPMTATTDAAGRAVLALTAAAAMQRAFTVSYGGDDVSGAGKGTGSLTVRLETVRVAPLKVTRSGTSRAVTATFTEDDPRALARQPVAWYVNGKKVATVATDAAGRSVFKAAKAGQKVQARYAGVSGCYAAVSSATVAV